jgi:hypothetical protein
MPKLNSLEANDGVCPRMLASGNSSALGLTNRIWKLEGYIYPHSS